MYANGLDYSFRQQEVDRTTAAKVMLVFLGAVLYQALFFQEKMALNFSLYSAFSLLGLWWFYVRQHSNPSFWWALLCHLLATASVLVHNTPLAKIAAVVSLLLCAVQAAFPHRSLYYAVRTAMAKGITALPLWVSSVFGLRKNFPSQMRQLFRLRIYVIPIMLALLFFGMYALANRVFGDVAEKLAEQVASLMGNLFNWLDADRLWLMLVGLVCTAALLLNRPTYRAFQKDQLAADALLRVRKKRRLGWLWADLQLVFFGRRAKGVMALKLEYKLAIVSFILLNGLLLMVNITDIVYVWFSRTYQPGFEWVAFVHEGAWMLVFSILIAMLVVLFFFRGNLNFLSQNSFLQRLALLWIVQNFILCVSVGIRNFYYIQHMGLAYKRIGLMFYLLLVAVGLATVAIKVLRLKSLHYLLKVNGWVVYVLLVLATLINWDVAIVRYNLQHRRSVPLDVEFLLTMHPATIPILEAHAAEISSLSGPIGRNRAISDTNWVAQYLQEEKEAFLAEQTGKTWLSWNWADWGLMKELAAPTQKNLK